MRYKAYSLWFIVRNWRYFHFHHVLRAELRCWWNDDDV